MASEYASTAPEKSPPLNLVLPSLRRKIIVQGCVYGEQSCRMSERHLSGRKALGYFSKNAAPRWEQQPKKKAGHARLLGRGEVACVVAGHGVN